MEDRGTLFDDDLLVQIRDKFANIDSDPVGGKRVYLENAGGGLTLKKVVEVVARETAMPDNAGRDNVTSREIDRLMTKGLEDVGLFIGATSGTVALGESTTSNVFKTLGAVICNVEGGNVVTTNLDHPSVYDATRILSERFNKEWRVAELSPESGTIEPEAVLKQIDAETIILTVIHSSNITGTRNDVKSIIKEARKIKPDLFVLLDGAQHASHCLLDMEDLGCDIYTVSSYKTFSKIGASVVYLSERAANLPHDRLFGKPKNYWEQGTREHAGYAAWSEVVDYLCWLGSRFVESADRRELIISAMGALEEHERALTDRMLNGTPQLPGMLNIDGLTVYGEVKDLSIKDPAFIFNIAGMTADEVVASLGEKGIRVHTRISDGYSRHTLRAMGIEEGVRVSLSHYNTPQDVDIFLKVIEQVKK